eukprot:7166174-Alexandrium_andersonii.AAC.1
MTAMGYPLTEEAQRAARNTKCQFSRGVPPPDARSHRSQVNQRGNAYHCNVLGSFLATILIRFDSLGRGQTDEMVDAPCKNTVSAKRPASSTGGGGSSGGS